MSSSIVLVTGASGYVASHIIQLLLNSGYKVKGTVRNLKDDSKVIPLMNLIKGEKNLSLSSASMFVAPLPLKLVEADLLDPISINNAMKNCKYVIHVASPFPSTIPKNEDDVIKPAVMGTTAVLEACRNNKIKRLILTSSVAALVGDFNKLPNNSIIDETKWGSDITSDIYNKSKILAEKKAWEFINNLSDEEKFELVVINPALVQGPLINARDSASFEIVKKLLERKMPLLPRMNICITDVRDVALAHVRALSCDQCVGHRHLISTGSYWIQDIAYILNKEFKDKGYSITTTSAPTIFMKLYSYFDPVVARILPNLDKQFIFKNDRMRNILKINPRPIESTIIDMAYSLIRLGLVPKSSKIIIKSSL